MARRFLGLITVLAWLSLPCGCGKTETPAPAEDSVSTQASSVEPAPEQLREDTGLEELERGARTVRLTGDLDAMIERGYVRVLVPYSKTYFFYEGARPRGLAYEFAEAFAEELRGSPGAKPVGLTVVFLPVARDRLIPGVAEGLGDLAIAGLTVTDERERVVDFVTQPGKTATEIVVTGLDAPLLRSVEDLSGKRVFVRKSSSYYDSLQVLNARLRGLGKDQIELILVDENLEIEDVLELVRSGVESITVADDYLAHFWADVMGDLDVRDDLVIREARPIGPVIRKNSPKLAAALRKFQKTHGIGTLFGNVVVNRYLRENPWVRNPNASADRRRFEKTLPLFRRYGQQFEFDALLLAAQGYQESRLDQSVRSAAGAVGVMQIKPSTAAAHPVEIQGVEDKIENNIHAGVKYLRHLVDDYFDDPGITPFNRHAFAIAAYNAGPTRIQRLRRKAQEQGLDPNVWFNNVELVSARALGRENVDYVRNVLKYWVAYRLAAQLDDPTS